MNIKKTQYEERRDSIRVKRIVTVRHRLLKHRGGRKVKSLWQMSDTQDMSLSGLCFGSAIDYKAGDIIELTVLMSGILEIFNGFGKVIRTNQNKGGSYQVAVQYVDLKPKSRPAKTILPSRKV